LLIEEKGVPGVLRLSDRLKKHREFVSIGMRVTYTGLAFLSTIFLTHLVGPGELGRYFAIVALILLIGSTVQSGWAPFLVREIASLQEQGRAAELAGIGRLAIRVVGGIAVLAAAIAILIGFLGHASPEDRLLLWIAVPIVPLLSTSSVRQAITRGMGHPLLGQICDSATRPGIQVLGLFCWWLGLFGGLQGAVAALTIFLVAIAVSAVVAYVIERRATSPVRKQVQPRVPPRPQWLGSLVRNAMIGWSAAVNEQIGTLILARFASHAEVALFRVATQTSLLLVLGLNAVIMVYAPDLSRSFARKDFPVIQELATKGAVFGLMSALPLAAGYLIFGSQLLSLLFGAQYSDAYLPLVVLTVGQLANGMFGLVMTMAIATRSEGAALKAQLLGASGNVLLCLLLVPSFGAVGAACASAVSLLIWNVFLSRYLLRNFGVRSFVTTGAVRHLTLRRRRSS
jgi:O-antigen/teichoic acid export membrane protein